MLEFVQFVKIHLGLHLLYAYFNKKLTKIEVHKPKPQPEGAQESMFPCDSDGQPGLLNNTLIINIYRCKKDWKPISEKKMSSLLDTGKWWDCGGVFFLYLCHFVFLQCCFMQLLKSYGLYFSVLSFLFSFFFIVIVDYPARNGCL